MALYYKLTDENWETKNHTKWGPGITNTASGVGELCTDAWIHVYLSPELAVLLNPIHADFKDPVLWEAEGEIGARDGQLKAGCKRVTTLRIVEAPAFTTEQRVKFAILCSKAVYTKPFYIAWADAWLSGKDRTVEAAEAAERAAEAAAERAERATAAAERAAVWATVWAAGATVWAARAAERAAERAARATAAAERAAEWAAERAAVWATQAAQAAVWAAAEASPFDLVAIARQALAP